jgi:excinuclease ABC subunit C
LDLTAYWKGKSPTTLRRKPWAKSKTMADVESSLKVLERNELIEYLKEKARNLPLSPGVYLMKDSLGEIIYVGKSKSLKNRVGSYFQNSKNRAPKIEKLVKNLKDFDFILTDTEFEAFILECKLIKKIKPMYNSLMKNPLSYTYIEIKINELYPKIEVSSEYEENRTNLYFGPYTSKNSVERTIVGIKEFYKINCSNTSKKNSACLNYSLGLCIGMCLGDSVKQEYQNIINKIIGLLNGSDKSILKEMEEKMLIASEKFDFEAAAKYRDYIEGVTVLLNKEKVIGFAEKNKNIVMIEYLNSHLIKLFLLKGNKILFSEKYDIENSGWEKISNLVKTNILAKFDLDTTYSSMEVNKEDLDEAQIIYSYLKSSNCSYIAIPDDWLHINNNTELDDAIKKLFGF